MQLELPYAFTVQKREFFGVLALPPAEGSFRMVDLAIPEKSSLSQGRSGRDRNSFHNTHFEFCIAALRPMQETFGCVDLPGQERSSVFECSADLLAAGLFATFSLFPWEPAAWGGIACAPLLLALGLIACLLAICHWTQQQVRGRRKIIRCWLQHLKCTLKMPNGPPACVVPMTEGNSLTTAVREALLQFDAVLALCAHSRALFICTHNGLEAYRPPNDRREFL